MLPEHALEAPAADALSSTLSLRLYIAPILSVALLLRVLMALLMVKHGTNLWFYNQASELGCLAQSVVAGHGLASPFCGTTGPSAFLAPGYPLLVALAFRLFGNYSIGATAMLIGCQIAFGLLIILSTMLIARNIFSTRIANITGTVCAISPTLIWLPVLFWETSFTMLSLTGVMALALHCAENPTRSSWAWLGVLCGGAMLVNPALMITFLAIVAWMMYQVRPKHRRASLITLVTWVLVFAIWPIRNQVVLHAFVPLRTNLGYELWQGNGPGSNGEFLPKLHLNVNRLERFRYAQIGEIAYMHEKSTIAISAIKADPARFARLSLRRTARFWLGLASKNNSALVIADLSITSLFATVGLLSLARRKPAYALLLAAPFLLFPLPYYITHADFRFRLVLDPIAIMLSVYVIGSLYSSASVGSNLTESISAIPDCGRRMAS